MNVELTVLHTILEVALSTVCIFTAAFGQGSAEPQKPQTSESTEHKSPAAKSGYAPVNGLRLYYEVRGSGEPLVLLHGGGSSLETSFGQIIDSLARSRQVIAFDQQGHSRTADVARRPFSFEQS